MSSYRRQLRTHQKAGFTLLELMVALVIGALVVVAMFTLGGASQRHFQEQQRVGVTQRSVRLAMERLRRDVGRAGYLHVPSNRAPRINNCAAPAAPRDTPAVWMVNDDPTGNAVLNGVNRATNGVGADRLRLIGSYDSGDPFLVRSFNGAGNVIFLQTDWLAFRRNFVVSVGGSPGVDVNRFNEVFRPGRMLHVESRQGRHIYLSITSRLVDGAGNLAQIGVSPGVGVDNRCLEGFGEQSIVSVLNEIEYSIQNPGAGSTLNPRSANVVGPNTLLVRDELDMTTRLPIPGTRRVVLEYAVDFAVDAFVDTNITAGLPPNIVFQQAVAAQTVIQNQPWQVRSLQVSIAARTPEQDRRFPWPYGGARPAGTPLNRFLVFPGQEGAARVRQLTTEINMPNMVPRS